MSSTSVPFLFVSVWVELNISFLYFKCKVLKSCRKPIKLESLIEFLWGAKVFLPNFGEILRRMEDLDFALLDTKRLFFDSWPSTTSIESSTSRCLVRELIFLLSFLLSVLSTSRCISLTRICMYLFVWKKKDFIIS